MVVSVLPCITEAILPIKESGPCCFNISFSTIKEEDPDTGLNIDNVNSSLGNFRRLNIGINKLVISFIILLFNKTFIDIIKANIVGNILRQIFNPSFTPSMNES